MWEVAFPGFKDTAISTQYSIRNRIHETLTDCEVTLWSPKQRSRPHRHAWFLTRWKIPRHGQPRDGHRNQIYDRHYLSWYVQFSQRHFYLHLRPPAAHHHLWIISFRLSLLYTRRSFRNRQAFSILPVFCSAHIHSGYDGQPRSPRTCPVWDWYGRRFWPSPQSQWPYSVPLHWSTCQRSEEVASCSTLRVGWPRECQKRLTIFKVVLTPIWKTTSFPNVCNHHSTTYLVTIYHTYVHTIINPLECLS